MIRWTFRICTLRNNRKLPLFLTLSVETFTTWSFIVLSMALAYTYSIPQPFLTIFLWYKKELYLCSAIKVTIVTGLTIFSEHKSITEQYVCGAFGTEGWTASWIYIQYLKNSINWDVMKFSRRNEYVPFRGLLTGDKEPGPS